MSEEINGPPEPLVGSFFIRVDDENASRCHGSITASLGDGYYLAAIHSPLDGAPIFEQVVSLADLAAGWEHAGKEYKFFGDRAAYARYCHDWQNPHDRRMADERREDGDEDSEAAA